jgi:quercetin dioxygenase-like cupin family protein
VQSTDFDFEDRQVSVGISCARERLQVFRVPPEKFTANSLLFTVLEARSVVFGHYSTIYRQSQKIHCKFRCYRSRAKASLRYTRLSLAPTGGQPTMPTLISQPTRIEAAGTRPKLIDEYIGRVNSKNVNASVAHMRSPAGWQEPGQRPEFDEFTVVLKGLVRVRHENGAIDVRAGQAVIAYKGEWVQYSTPEGAEYIAVCMPAFSPATVHRDAE